MLSSLCCLCITFSIIALSEAVRWDRSGLPSGPVFIAFPPVTLDVPDAPPTVVSMYIEECGKMSLMSPPHDIGKNVPPGATPELELGPNPESEPWMLEVDTLPMLLTTPVHTIQ